MNVKTKNIVISIIIVVAILATSALTGLFTAISMGGIQFPSTETLNSSTSNTGSSTTTPDTDDDQTDKFLENTISRHYKLLPIRQRQISRTVRRLSRQ